MQKLTTLILFLLALVAQAQTPADWKKLTGTLNFYTVSYTHLTLPTT